MTGVVDEDWPTADLDTLRQLQVIAGAAKYPSYAERHFDVPVRQLWSVASDLERELPHIVSGLRSFTILESGGDRHSGRAVSVIGHRERFEVVLRPGWCLMQGRVLTSGMAAVPEGEGSRFAFYSSARFPGGQVVDRVRRLRAEHRFGKLFDRLQQRVAARSFPDIAE
ncbi:hypothetical protein LHJ74_05030 [Streptomyces sp. N2-109]|uniref:Uncharacterized protein n=1 Tax=Streptomyces gossypii TaxID=2883101 RepID=A0ABT2JN39_9ACTN|nr:hypothetical protein [Streptomyces gossypii]MCT2589302.1 hypothetical protein [Streptomyces gossypii]